MYLVERDVSRSLEFKFTNSPTQLNKDEVWISFEELSNIAYLIHPSRIDGKVYLFQGLGRHFNLAILDPKTKENHIFPFPYKVEEILGVFRDEIYFSHALERLEFSRKFPFKVEREGFFLWSKLNLNTMTLTGLEQARAIVIYRDQILGIITNTQFIISDSKGKSVTLTFRSIMHHKILRGQSLVLITTRDEDSQDYRSNVVDLETKSILFWSKDKELGNTLYTQRLIQKQGQFLKLIQTAHTDNSIEVRFMDISSGELVYTSSLKLPDDTTLNLNSNVMVENKTYHPHGYHRDPSELILSFLSLKPSGIAIVKTYHVGPIATYLHVREITVNLPVVLIDTSHGTILYNTETSKTIIYENLNIYYLSLSQKDREIMKNGLDKYFISDLSKSIVSYL